MIYSISIIGSGNLATQLAIALKKANHNIVEIYSRDIKNAKTLSLKVDANFTSEISKLQDVDIFIIAVSDIAISSVLNKLETNNIVAHVSGSTSIDIFENKFENFGVFYPYQTFTKNRNISFEYIPICIESSNNDSTKKLKSLAESISNNIQIVNSEKRKILHLSAVFSCNFTNHILSLSKDILEQENIDFEISKELVIETINKAFRLSPNDAQTGPAKRNDTNIIDNHLELLSYSPKMQDIYSILTKNIQNKYE